MTFNDPGDEVTGRHAPRKRRTYKVPNAEQGDLLAGTSTPPQPPRHKSAGERRKDHILDVHEGSHNDRLTFLREELKKLYKQRKSDRGYDPKDEVGVTADDAHKILAAHANLGYLDDDAAKPWFGAIFREEGWRRTGNWIPSLRDTNNGRLIPSWKWTGG